MTLPELKLLLESINHSREKRATGTQLIFKNPSLIPQLFKVANEVDTPISCRAMWLLEFVCREDLKQILPYLSTLTEMNNKIHLQPGIRPAAKICEYLITDFYQKKTIDKLSEKLTKEYRKKIASSCFDWLINSKTKVAAKAYSMTSLYLLGKEFDWIHPELKLILEQNYAEGSSAYKARSRMILKKID